MGQIEEPLLRKLGPPEGLFLSAVSAHRQQWFKGHCALARFCCPLFLRAFGGEDIAIPGMRGGRGNGRPPRPSSLRAPSLMVGRPLAPPVWSTAPVISRTSPIAPSHLPEPRLHDPPGVLPVRRHRVGGLPATEVAKRARTDQQDRGAALTTIWRIVAKHFPQASAVQVVLGEGSDPLGSASLRAMVERKSNIHAAEASLQPQDVRFMAVFLDLGEWVWR